MTTAKRVLATKAGEVKAIVAGEGSGGNVAPIVATLLLLRALVVGVGRVGEALGIGPAETGCCGLLRNEAGQDQSGERSLHGGLGEMELRYTRERM